MVPSAASEGSVPICDSCGAEIEVDAAFCNTCGTSIAPSTTSTPTDEATVDSPRIDGTDAQNPPGPTDSDPTVINPRLAPDAAGASSSRSTSASGFVTCQHCHILLSPIEVAGGTCTSCGTAIVAAATVVSGVTRPLSGDDLTETPTTMIPSSQTARMCAKCGQHLEPGASFCTVCGSDTGSGAPPPLQNATNPNDRNDRLRLVLLASGVGIVIGVLAVGAWIALMQLGDDNNDSETSALPTITTAPPQNATTVVSDTDTDTTVTSEATTVTSGTTTATSGDTSAACWDLGVRGVDATESLGAAFETASTGELAAMARAGRTALPGATAFDGEWSAIAAESTAVGCDAAELDTSYTTEKASRRPPPGAHAALVWSTQVDARDMSIDPLTQVASALLMYPIHDPIAATAVLTPGTDLPMWVVMLSSMNTDESDRADAQARADEYTSKGIPAEILLTINFGSLTPGYWAVYTGPFADRDEAREFARSIKSTVSDAYQRYVQVLPSTDPPFGPCGPYGMIDISGVDADKYVSVLSRPENDRAEVTQLRGTATAVLVAGPSESAGGSWTPLAVNGTIGWIKTQYATDNAACPRTSAPTSSVSCEQISTATIGLFNEISGSAARAGESGTTTAIAPGQFDDAAMGLVGQASASRCSSAGLNVFLAANRSQVATSNSFSELTVATLYAAPFYRDG